MEALGYKTSLGLLITQLEKLAGRTDMDVFVLELDNAVVGFISVHYLPQLGFDGELVQITYLSADETIAKPEVAKELEVYMAEQARKRKCDRIQVHCHDWRVSTHGFYIKQGYTEYPKYFTKRLIYGE